MARPKEGYTPNTNKSSRPSSNPQLRRKRAAQQTLLNNKKDPFTEAKNRQDYTRRPTTTYNPGMGPRNASAGSLSGDGKKPAKATAQTKPTKPNKSSNKNSRPGTAYKPSTSKKPSGSVGGGSGGRGSNTSAKKAPAKKSATKKATASKTDYGKVAREAVSAELDPKIKTLKDQQRAYNREQQLLQEENKTRGKQVSKDLEFLYSELDKKLAEYQGKSAASYGSAAATVDQNYANLISSLTSNTQQSVDKVNAEAARLGLAAPVESQAGADGNFANMLAQTNRQNAALMIAAQKGNAAETGNFIRNAEQGLGVQTNADFTTSNNRALNDLVNQQLAKDTEYDDQIGSLEMQRSTMERQYLQQLEQQAYDRAQEAAQQQFMNSLATGRFNLDQDKFYADQAYRQEQLKLDQAKIQAAAQKAAGAQKPALNPGGAVDYLKATISHPDTETGLLQALNFARYNGQFDFYDTKNRPQVIESMRQWLQQNRPDLIKSNEFLGYLSTAYDIFTGVKYA